MSLSVAIITKNEEANLRRTLESVKWADEIVIVDSGSTDRTCEIAREYGAKVFVEEWKGFAAQKNSAMAKCTGDWILSLDADEVVSDLLMDRLPRETADNPNYDEYKFIGFKIARRNYFLGRWMRRGGFYPDLKLRVIRNGRAQYQDRLVHEDLVPITDVADASESYARLKGHLIHHAYPTLAGYIEHMNRYSDLGAQMVAEKRRVSFSFTNIILRPIITFIYNYFFRRGFLDGREGLLLHLYHSVYVSWKYAKAWELSKSESLQRQRGAEKSKIKSEK